MGRSAASIQTEITAIEAQLAVAVVGVSASADAVAYTQQQYDKLTDRLDRLYQQLERANGTAPMLVRGYMNGLH